MLLESQQKFAITANKVVTGLLLNPVSSSYMGNLEAKVVELFADNTIELFFFCNYQFFLHSVKVCCCSMWIIYKSADLFCSIVKYSYKTFIENFLIKFEVAVEEISN